MATRETDWTVVLGSSRSSLKVSPLKRAACSILDPIRLRLKSCLVANPVILSPLFPGSHLGSYQLIGKMSRMQRSVFLTWRSAQSYWGTLRAVGTCGVPHRRLNRHLDEDEN